MHLQNEFKWKIFYQTAFEASSMVCQCEPSSFETNCRKNQLVMMEQRACLSMRVEALSRVARIRTCRVRIRSAGGLSHSRANTPAASQTLEPRANPRASSKPFEPRSTLEPRSNPSRRANPSSVEQTLRASSKPCKPSKPFEPRAKPFVRTDRQRTGSFVCVRQRTEH